MGPTGPAGSANANGAAGQVAYFNGATSVVSSANFTWDNVNRTLTVSSAAAGGSAVIGTNSSATNASVGVLGSATGAGNVSGVQGQTSSTVAGATGVSGFATGATGNIYGVYGQSNSTTGVGVYGFANVAQGSGVIGSSQVAGAAGGNFGVTGFGNNNTNYSAGVDGETATANMDGIRGLATGATGGMSGVYAVNASTVGGNNAAFGLYGQASGAAASAGTQHLAVYGTASGAQYNAGMFVGAGETVISNSQTLSATPQLPRSWAGSMFTQAANSTTTGGRIWWSSGGFIWYVQATGSADYSEFFFTADPSLGVGEVVAIDPEISNAVRRARPSDRSTTVGVVSAAGTRYNNNRLGNRDDDPNYINVGMMGQVPVLISLENGDIEPGDPLTVSTRYRGRVTKATGPARIIGFATTHYPYVDGEQDYLEDVNGGAQERLTQPHVMCYLNVGWYEPTDYLGDGEEPPPVESEHDMRARLNREIVPPLKEEQDRRAAVLRAASDLRSNVVPAEPPPVQAPYLNTGSSPFLPADEDGVDPDLLFTPQPSSSHR